MCSRCLPALLAVSLFAGCGADGTSTPSASDPPSTDSTVILPTTPSTAAPSVPATEPTVPTTSPLTSTTSTSTAPLDAVGGMVLRPSGIGPVDFGTPADEALASLVDALGPPDNDTTVTDPECARAIEQTRSASWNALDLHALFTDWGGSYALPAAPLHLARWSTSSVTSDPRMTTPDRLRVGAVAADVRALPRASLIIPEVIHWGFTVSDNTGSVSGVFDWSIPPPHYFIDPQFTVALQAALNAHGARLTQDGVIGPATIDALEHFATSEDIEGFEIEFAADMDGLVLTRQLLDVLWRLGLPPDDATIVALSAGDELACG